MCVLVGVYMYVCVKEVHVIWYWEQVLRFVIHSFHSQLLHIPHPLVKPTCSIVRMQWAIIRTPLLHGVLKCNNIHGGTYTHGLLCCLIIPSSIISSCLFSVTSSLTRPPRQYAQSQMEKRLGTWPSWPPSKQSTASVCVISGGQPGATQSEEGEAAIGT